MKKLMSSSSILSSPLPNLLNCTFADRLFYQMISGHICMPVTNLEGVQKAHRKWPSSPQVSLEAVVSVSPLAKQKMRGRHARNPRVKPSLGWKETETTATQAHQQSLCNLDLCICAKESRDPDNQAGPSVTLWVHISCRTLISSLPHAWRKKHFVLPVS